MTAGTHIDFDILSSFVAGQLGKSETNQVMTHLAECEECLVRVDDLWARQPTGAAIAVGLDDRTAIRMERHLISRIHRSNLAETILSLGTEGFMSVAMTLLRPFLGSNSQRSEQ